ncbi:MAG: OmpA family protein [Myxococcota bacterium]|nr:OmpA family protein [Myxococcota bacterium]
MALGLAALLLLGTGCVTRGTHREVVAERDAARAEAARLAERLQLLEASNESLSAERVELIGAVEDLRQAREALAEELEALRAEREALEESLARRERELAAQRSEVSELRGTYDALVQDLETEVASGRIQIEQLREGIRVNLAQEILFPLGSAELGAEGRDVLGRVARRLAEVPNPIEVRGHTDDLPIHGRLAARYPSNWELGGARAARVVRLLAQEGIAPDRLQAVSFADTRPVASNATPEGRARNRRIEIRLLPLPDEVAPPPEEAGSAPTP